jgi:hypothetical protein
MHWTIPDIPLSREPNCPCEPIEFGSTHVPCPWDFCRACGTDLRIARLLVCSVGYADMWRLHVCEIAACCRTGDLAECIKLGISCDDRLKLADLFYEGLGPAVEHVICGFDSVDLVGITADGTFLYSQRGEYQIGAESHI